MAQRGDDASGDEAGPSGSGDAPARLAQTGNLMTDYPPIEIPPPPPPIQSFDGSGPRLIITKIVNENFKSYAGKRTLGPFHKNFTCIIGPNGSGKSNVIDSMLFVFGYRATKIRSKKVSVLIHQSETLPDLNCCNVEVHFQRIINTGVGDEDFQVVENSQFVISRTAYKDNSSNYTIDGWRKTYKEVATFLKAHGIDLDHNRFLILQGEVEQISLMKPKAPTEHEDGLLEYLEDIIGSSRFKTPLEQLGKRIEEMNELRQEQLNRVKVIEREKSELEGVRNEALDFLRLCNKVVSMKNMLYQKYHMECQATEAAALEKKQDIETQRDKAKEKVTGAEKSKKAKQEELRLVVERYQELQAIYTTNKERFSELEAEDSRLRDEHKHTKQQIKQLLRLCATETTKMEELKAAPNEAAARIEELNQKLERLIAKKAKEDANYEKAMSGLQDETKELRSKKESKETQLNTIQEEVTQRQSALQLAKSELDLLLSNERREQGKLDQAQTQINGISTKLEEKRKQLTVFETELPNMQTALNNAKTDLEQVQSKETELNAEVRQLRAKLEEAKLAYRDVSTNRVLNTLMEQTASGKIPGILGRLGDLGGIDAKYDIAISTACGALDHIVTDTIDIAQKCVQFLKQYNMGQGIFIGLDKMERWRNQASQRINTPENVPRLFDLIKIQDKRVIPAFYFALKDTLVADNLEQASRIAYGERRFRVVTLQGQLIETSGAMTGGGGRPQQGRMGKNAKGNAGGGQDRAAMEELEGRLADRGQAGERVRETRARLEETMVKLERDTRDIKKNFTSAKAESTRLEGQLNALKDQARQTEARLKAATPDPAKVSSLEKDVESLTKSHQEVDTKATKLKTEVDKLHNAIMDIGGAKLGTIQSRVKEVQNEITETKTQLNKINVSVKTAERSVVKLVEKIENTEREVEEKKARLEEVSTILKTRETEAAELMTKFTDAQKQTQGLSTEIEERKGGIEELEAEEQNLRKKVAEIGHQLTEAKERVEASRSRTVHWRKELSRLKLHRVPLEDEEEEQQLTQADWEERTRLKQYTLEELAELTVNQIDITNLDDQAKNMKPNMAAIEEYRRKEEMYMQRVGELEKVTQMREEQRRLQESCKKQRLDEFMTGFSSITGSLKEMYQMITLGGDAELELVDSLDPFSEGIVFSVRPPKKSWKNISNLSGGEKTLSSLALVFALHHYKPTPLYVMDEIDAALDFKNVSIVANYIKERTQNAQFVIISLRSNMFELANRLVGIYKTHNCTKTVTVNPTKLQVRGLGGFSGVVPSTTQNTQMNGFRPSEPDGTKQPPPVTVQQQLTEPVQEPTEALSLEAEVRAPLLTEGEEELGSLDQLEKENQEADGSTILVAATQEVPLVTKMEVEEESDEDEDAEMSMVNETKMEVEESGDEEN